MTSSAMLPSPTAPGPHLRWAWLALLAILLAIAAGAGLDRLRDSAGPTRLDPATIRPGFGPRTFAEARAAAEAKVVGARESYVAAPGEWLRGEVLAGALIGRWRLEGDYADLVEAGRLLDDGVSQTPDPGGPVLTQATLAVLVHKLNLADVALARFSRSVAPETGELSDAAALAGDMALQRGQLETAEAHYARAARITDTGGIKLRRAVLAGHRGDRDRASLGLEQLLARPLQPPVALAELALQRTNLAYAEGDWESAAAWIAAANRFYPGYWLAEAYAAQGEALAGRPANAIRAYRAIATRTGRPEVMDALAHLLRLEGQGKASRAWAAKAQTGWARRAALLPEAANQHYAEHELAVGSATKALALAQADVAKRPGPPGIALLVRALLASGRPKEALQWLDRVEASGWVSAGMLMLRAEAFAALGDSDASDVARDKALAINPRAADPAARLVWFGHD